METAKVPVNARNRRHHGGTQLRGSPSLHADADGARSECRGQIHGGRRNLAEREVDRILHETHDGQFRLRIGRAADLANRLADRIPALEVPASERFVDDGDACGRL